MLNHHRKLLYLIANKFNIYGIDNFQTSKTLKKKKENTYHESFTSIMLVGFVV